MPIKEIPKVLYKYRQWDNPFHSRILTNNEIFLSSPANFNDPFDSSLPFKYKKEELTPENIYKKLIEVMRKYSPNISELELQNFCYERQRSGIYESGEYWKEFYDDTKNQIFNDFGIMSLTTKNDNLLMWSHYANGHQGLCIGLDTEILFNTISGRLAPVFYSSSFPEIGLFEKDIRNWIQLVNTKSKHWQYEDEYRLTKTYSANMVFSFPKEMIKEIILGCSMKIEYKKEIYEIIDRNFPHAELFEAKTNIEDFMLDILHITRL